MNLKLYYSIGTWASVQLSKLNVKSFVKLQLCSGEVSKTVEELFYNVHWNLDDFSLPANPTDVAN